MIAFTILGLLVFWVWCFSLGYALGFGAEVLDALLSFRRVQKRFHDDLAAMLATLQGVAK